MLPSRRLSSVGSGQNIYINFYLFFFPRTTVLLHFFFLSLATPIWYARVHVRPCRICHRVGHPHGHRVRPDNARRHSASLTEAVPHMQRECLIGRYIYTLTSVFHVSSCDNRHHERATNSRRDHPCETGRGGVRACGRNRMK